MRLGKDLENKPIISLTEGRMLGRAKDVYVDAELQQLAGLYLGSEGMIRRKAQVIQNDDVVLFGIDAVLVKDSDVVKKDKDLAETVDWYRLNDLQGYEVHTPGGTKLGTVGDIILDGMGAIIGFSLSRVFVKGPLAEQGTVPRETVVETVHREEVIFVDLAMLEGMATGEDEKAPAVESSEEEAVEEISIEVVEDEEKSAADPGELGEQETETADDEVLDSDADEQEQEAEE